MRDRGRRGHTGKVLTHDLAARLRAAGLAWSPERGDRFWVPDRDLDDEVFVLSDMVIETMTLPGVGEVLAFNGSTEWALDSLEASEAVWLPREDQLRELLGRAFVSLEQHAGPPTGFAVGIDVDGAVSRHVDTSVEAAYARALLALLEG